MLFFFAIHDKRCVELPFIQMLTCALFVWFSRWSTPRDFLMIYVSLRSHNPVLTLWLLPGFASPPNIFL